MNGQVFKYHKVTIERLEKFISHIYFTDVNIYGKIYPRGESVDVPKITCFSVPDLKQMDFEEAVHQEFRSTQIGESFNPSWSTHWFCLEFSIPKSFRNKEVHLLWDCSAESMLYNEEGHPLQSFTGTNEHFKRHDFILTRKFNPESKEKDKRIFYIELACNGLFGCGNNGFINPPDPNKSFCLKTCSVSVFDRLAYDLYLDMRILYNMAKQLKETNQRRALQAMTVGNDIVNLFRINDRRTWEECLKLSHKFFQEKSGESSHLIYSCGHSHLDVAWLWPYKETERKAGRTFITQCLLMDDSSDFLFAQSQAVLYDWVKRRYPMIYQRVKEKVKSCQWIPVGGTWVEFDGNLPGGEAMCRQFLYGQKFFREEFGKTCEIFWLPDTFGYSSQLPQIMKLSGCNYFLTQKLSWNLINKFPHSTFYWKGLDGTSVLSHFPPCDTYCAEFKVEEMIKQATNFKDSDKSNRSILLFGHGDGAGGPKREHCDIYQRFKLGIDGLAKVKMSNPIHFFRDVEKDEESNRRLNIWSGELYFELHRGTYTSQATTKKNNRHCELLLRDCEFLAVIQSMLMKEKSEYPYEMIERCWKNVLLNQFHDVLPGSSIECVYRDADSLYEEVYEGCGKIKDTFFESTTKKNKGTSVIANTLSFDRDCIIEISSNEEEEEETEGEQDLKNERRKKTVLVECKVPGMSVMTIDHEELKKEKKKKSEENRVKLSETDEKMEVENEFVKLVIYKKKSFRMDVINKKTGEKVMSEGNKFYLFDDVPLFWDAWDAMIYHLEKYDDLENQDSDEKDDNGIRVIENDPLRVRIQLPRLRISDNSWIDQVIEIDSLSGQIRFDTIVEWNENRRFLKVGFPTTIQSDYASYDIQFGHLLRSTFKNTSWDYAKCEVSCQKWFDLTEYNSGLSVLNESKYGCAVWKGNEMMLSLLRSPKAPDGNCDMGRHHFKYALFPHSKSIQEDLVHQKGYEFSVPIIRKDGVCMIDEKKEWVNLFSVNSDQIVIETVKRSEKGDGIVVRLYETFGGKADVKLSVLKDGIVEVVECNILEDVIRKIEKIDSSKNGRTEVDLQFSNFEIKSILFKI